MVNIADQHGIAVPQPHPPLGILPSREPADADDTTATGDAVPTAASAVPRSREPRAAVAARYVIAGIRLALGWVFLWAFLDKLFGLGRGTAAANRG
jgi:thiosulfate dehydrogenase [quinone] large subunit